MGMHRGSRSPSLQRSSNSSTLMLMEPRRESVKNLWFCLSWKERLDRRWADLQDEVITLSAPMKREYTQRVVSVTPRWARVSAFFNVSTRAGLPSAQSNDVETWTSGKFSDILGLDYWMAVR